MVWGAGMAEPASSADSTATRLTEDRRQELTEEREWRRSGPKDPAAAVSGHWWSVPVVADHSTRAWPGGPRAGEPVAATCFEDASFQPDEACWASVDVPSGGRVLEIASAEDWAGLCRAHPLDVSASRRYDWYRCTGRLGEWVIPDRAGVAQKWDGVHLSVAAYLELAGRPLAVDEARSSVIAGWSPDLTYWLTDVERGGRVA